MVRCNLGFTISLEKQAGSGEVIASSTETTLAPSTRLSRRTISLPESETCGTERTNKLAGIIGFAVSATILCATIFLFLKYLAG